MPFNQPLAGLVEPTARSWKTAKDGDRLAFYREAGRIAVEAKRKELRRAIGSNGRRMKPRKLPRPDGANGPVLTPHDDASRTARLLDARAWSGGLTLFWHSGLRKGQKRPWGTILGYHAEGKVRGAPKRDVRLSRRGLTSVRKLMVKWWTNHLTRSTKAANRKAAADALAAEVQAQAEARAASSKPARKTNQFSRSQQALIKRYSGLKAHFRGKGQGF